MVFMLCFNISDIAIITVKNADDRMIHEISKFDAIHFCEILCLKIVDVYKMHIKEINIKKSLQLLF